MADRAWFRGEGGGVWLMDLPLSEDMTGQVAKGLLVQLPDPPDGPAPTAGAPALPAEPVDPDGGEGEVGEVPGKPAQSDPKAAWVAYAHHVTGRDLTDLDALTKADLIKEVG